MFEHEILALIAKKHEGGYWDFKREWYTADHVSDLLHDIICMANNLLWRDAYIIIGVDEERDYAITDVSADPNRRNTQNMVTFLRDKQFAGQIRPEIEVQSIQLTANGIVDVIVIKESRFTPFYLTKRFQQLSPYHIYTRIQDTNTPVDSSADLHIVERLWKNRFSLNLPAKRHAQALLADPDSWETEEVFQCSFYHSVFPEFKISYEYLDDRNGYEYYLFSQFNSNPHWYEVQLFCHQTVLFSCIGISLDSGATFTPCPETGFIHERDYHPLKFCYFVKGTMRYILHEFFFHKETSREASYANSRFMECILLFESESEKDEFMDYADSCFANYADVEVRLPYFSEENSCYAEDYRTALIAQRILVDYRKVVNGEYDDIGIESDNRKTDSDN